MTSSEPKAPTDPTTAEDPHESRYPRPPVTLDEAERVWRELASEAMRVDAKPETARLAVITGLVRATGARYGDLLRMRVDDLDLGPETARAAEGSAVVRHGKHRVSRRHRLPADLVVLLRHWMAVREELAAELEGSAPRALLLTVHHTHDNGTTVASGLPITRQGLVLSWRRFVHRTNARYGATRPPLPTRFEQVRRAWTGAGAGEED
ncbi:tyrosine-type recombinase/integrase [Myceligenerans salitolerans]|uniref:Tyrosine-type recombinase/integrase n=1 Tax=Myceligenerans salitolerans TaxID=1230528 RepID=A0ABS3IB62_9MICO|nr:tyrosine-type recombinase/integrase [Myceligenerans salitolerans]MBO0610233.1 tyrosine-type recombinase/integrase [Myceligenerans salitolerans]